MYKERQADTRSPRPSPRLSAGVVALAAGYFHTCALLAGGGVDCWGNNGNGELGTDNTTDTDTPTGVTGLGAGGRRAPVYTVLFSRPPRGDQADSDRTGHRTADPNRGGGGGLGHAADGDR